LSSGNSRKERREENTKHKHLEPVGTKVVIQREDVWMVSKDHGGKEGGSFKGKRKLNKLRGRTALGRKEENCLYDKVRTVDQEEG